MRLITRGDEDRFWAVIDEVRQVTGGTYPQAPPATAENLKKILLAKPDPVVREFASIMHRVMVRLNRWEVWGAGMARNKSMSSAEFYAFRLWIVAKGQDAYDAIRAKPDSLVNWVKPTEVILNEGFDDAVGEIIEDRGMNDPRDDANESPNDFPKGKEFKEADLAKLFPQCWAAGKS
jgi:hypothetical protein